MPPASLPACPLPHPPARPLPVALPRLRPAAAALADSRLTGPPCEALVKSLTRLYKLLVGAAKAQLPAAGGCWGPLHAWAAVRFGDGGPDRFYKLLVGAAKAQLPAAGE